MKPGRWAAAVAAFALSVSGCATGAWEEGSTTWVIATTNFSETNILAQMYKQEMEHNGLTAEIKQLSNREVIVPALESGEVQITPEYLSSFTEFVNKQINGSTATPVASGDADATYAAALPLAAQKNVTLLTPSAAQDQNAFAVTAEYAAKYNLVNVSDLAALSQNQAVTLGGPPECPKRPFCQPGLEQTYGVKVASFVPLDAGGPLTVESLKQGKIDVGLVFSSSGSVAGNNLVVLKDDKHLQNAENITPAVYTPALNDQVRASLDAVSAVLTTEDLQRMNQAVEVERQNPRLVAQDFLTSKGLL